MRKVALIMALILLAVPASSARAVRLGELIAQECVRANQDYSKLICSQHVFGYGLVVGLDGTGDRDQDQLARQAKDNFLTGEKVGLPEGFENMPLQNMASVTVTASLAIAAGAGDQVDVELVPIGDASSLDGGMLLAAQLTGADGEPYVSVEGPVVKEALTEKAAWTTRGQVTTPPARNWRAGAVLVLKLAQPDESLAVGVARVINSRWPEIAARRIDDSTVEFTVPESYDRKTAALMYELRGLEMARPTK